MSRVNPDEVKEILSTDLDDPIILSFITAANLTVTKLIGSNSNISSSQLKEVERWLAAHFIACSKDHKAGAEAIGDARITYQGETGLGLDSTFYGQTAKVLDTTGTLASSTGKRKTTVHAITSFE